MPNTSLPTSLAPGATNHIDNHKVVHTEINRMSRDTGLRDCSTLLVNGWKLTGSSPYIFIRIRDHRVTLHIRGLDGSAATDALFLRFGTAAVEEGLPRVSTAFRASSEVAAQYSYKSPAQFDDQGALFGIEVVGQGVRTSSALPNHMRNLGVYERTIEWNTVGWPSFLPPSA